MKYASSIKPALAAALLLLSFGVLAQEAVIRKTLGATRAQIRTAWLVDNHRPFNREAYVCKLMGSEIASKCVSYAMEIHGALGLSRDYPLERAFRDARIAEIFEGTNEIQRIIIARDLLREVGVAIEP